MEQISDSRKINPALPSTPTHRSVPVNPARLHGFVVMSEMLVQIICRCTTWNVVIPQLSLVEARGTHVRVNNEPSTPPEASLAHAKIYFIVYLWQGIANGSERKVFEA